MGPNSLKSCMLQGCLLKETLDWLRIIQVEGLRSTGCQRAWWAQPFFESSPWPSLKLFELSRQFPTWKLGEWSSIGVRFTPWPFLRTCTAHQVLPLAVNVSSTVWHPSWMVVCRASHVLWRYMIHVDTGGVGGCLCVKPCYQGCPAENMNPFKEPTFSELPRCLLSCPDPPMLPEGYRKTISFSAAARDSRIWVLQCWADCSFFFLGGPFQLCWLHRLCLV